MARETRTALRTTPTATHVKRKQKGFNRNRVASTTASGSAGEITLTVPNKADYMVIENTGTTDIVFVFGTDVFSHAWELKPNAGMLSRTPEFAVNDQTEVKVRSQGGTGDIQYMFWG
jgi:hypothetical protein